MGYKKTSDRIVISNERTTRRKNHKILMNFLIKYFAQKRIAKAFKKYLKQKKEKELLKYKKLAIGYKHKYNKSIMNE